MAPRTPTDMASPLRASHICLGKNPWPHLPPSSPAALATPLHLRTSEVPYCLLLKKWGGQGRIQEFWLGGGRESGPAGP